MNKRRIVITGMGTINALGHNVDETWKNLLAGKSGVDHITNFEITDEYTSRIAGEIKNYDPKKYFERKKLKKMDPYTQYALIASKEAIEDSGLNNADFNHDRAGV
ncbi:MAG: beta-ketoacyl-[acyl-carrier-protein] synthase II, partial [Candidatus Cloacimonetes bacterium]|nr:beta-ketoacyl-[acyl-carrier-protein] synthase II [Candidatus Cloacimonadota bacterium]